MSQTKAKSFLEFILLIPIGILVLALTLNVALSTAKILNLVFNGKTAQGLVVDIKTSKNPSPKSHSMRKPIIEFSHEGKAYRFIEEAGTWSKDSDLTGQVEVVFNPQRPKIASINSAWYLWYSPIVKLLIALTFSIATVLFHPRLRALRKKTNQ